MYSLLAVKARVKPPPPVSHFVPPHVSVSHFLPTGSDLSAINSNLVVFGDNVDKKRGVRVIRSDHHSTCTVCWL